ncbi:uncharacterized protein PG998_001587 [Apiospora kogelbergensis]|uniref:uncharacterized protein n=1 Tax=Apiospora kogelbergensis TaxID=1337665 RepID=UPI00312E7159
MGPTVLAAAVDEMAVVGSSHSGNWDDMLGTEPVFAVADRRQIVVGDTPGRAPRLDDDVGSCGMGWGRDAAAFLMLSQGGDQTWFSTAIVAARRGLRVYEPAHAAIEESV